MRDPLPPTGGRRGGAGTRSGRSPWGGGRRAVIPTFRAAPFPLPLRPALPARVPPVAPYARGPRLSVAPAAPVAAVGGWRGLG